MRNQTSIVVETTPPYLSSNHWGLTRSENQPGFNHKLLTINPSVGAGYVEVFEFDQISLQIFDLSVQRSFSMPLILRSDQMHLSFLLHGEQIIRQKGFPDISFEHLESYWIRKKEFQGELFFPPGIKWHEIGISLSSEFVDKYQLNASEKTIESIESIEKRFFGPRERTILLEILKNRSEGVLKHIFIEGKILELLSIRMDQNKLSSKELSCPQSLLQNLFSVKEIIAQNIHEHFSIYHLAKKVGMNESSLKKEFKRVFGTTITRYTFRIRMHKAIELLKHSDQPIYEISEAVGYKNPTHFTAAFKKTYSCTPKVYRNMYMEQQEVFS